jgi:hypothetical protein
MKCVTPPKARASLLEAVAVLPGQVHGVVNESYLLTGLPASTLHAVLQNGLNERFSGANAGTMFGEGSYFAEDAGKCDQYTRAADVAYKQRPELRSLHDLLYQSGDEHPGDVCYMLVCRVVLGYTLRTQHSCGHGSDGRGTAMDAGATDDGTVFATRRHKECARRFHSLLSILAEIYLCHTCHCHEILRMETPGQVEGCARLRAASALPLAAGGAGGLDPSIPRARRLPRRSCLPGVRGRLPSCESLVSSARLCCNQFLFESFSRNPLQP